MKKSSPLPLHPLSAPKTFIHFRKGRHYVEPSHENKTVAEEPNADTIETIEKAENGIDIYGPFDSVEEMMEALNSDMPTESN